MLFRTLIVVKKTIISQILSSTVSCVEMFIIHCGRFYHMSEVDREREGPGEKNASILHPELSFLLC